MIVFTNIFLPMSFKNVELWIDRINNIVIFFFTNKKKYESVDAINLTIIHIHIYMVCIYK